MPMVARTRLNRIRNTTTRLPTRPRRGRMARRKVRALGPCRPPRCLTIVTSLIIAASFQRRRLRALARSRALSEGLRHAKEEAAPRAILGREHADTAAVADLVVGVAEIDDVAAHR